MGITENRRKSEKPAPVSRGALRVYVVPATYCRWYLVCHNHNTRAGVVCRRAALLSVWAWAFFSSLPVPVASSPGWRPPFVGATYLLEYRAPCAVYSIDRPAPSDPGLTCRRTCPISCPLTQQAYQQAHQQASTQASQLRLGV